MYRAPENIKRTDFPGEPLAEDDEGRERSLIFD